MKSHFMDDVTFPIWRPRTGLMRSSLAVLVVVIAISILNPLQFRLMLLFATTTTYYCGSLLPIFHLYDLVNSSIWLFVRLPGWLRVLQDMITFVTIWKLLFCVPYPAGVRVLRVVVLFLFWCCPIISVRAVHLPNSIMVSHVFGPLRSSTQALLSVPQARVRPFL